MQGGIVPDLSSTSFGQLFEGLGTSIADEQHAENRTSKANRLRVWLSANGSEAATALLALADYIEAMKTRLSSQRSTCLMNNYSACAISLGTFGQPHLRWHLAASGSALAVAPGPSTRAPDTVRVLP